MRFGRAICIAAIVLIGAPLLTAMDCEAARHLRDQAASSYGRGSLASAVSGLRGAKTACPAEPFYTFMLANALYRQEDFVGSMQNYAEFLDRRPDHLEARMCLGFVLLETADYKKAVDAWSVAVRQNPESPFAHSALALGLWKLGDQENAAIQYEVATRLGRRGSAGHRYQMEGVGARGSY